MEWMGRRIHVLSRDSYDSSHRKANMLRRLLPMFIHIVSITFHSSRRLWHGYSAPGLCPCSNSIHVDAIWHSGELVGHSTAQSLGFGSDLLILTITWGSHLLVPTFCHCQSESLLVLSAISRSKSRLLLNVLTLRHVIILGASRFDLLLISSRIVGDFQCVIRLTLPRGKQARILGEWMFSLTRSPNPVWSILEIDLTLYFDLTVDWFPKYLRPLPIIVLGCCQYSAANQVFAPLF